MVASTPILAIALAAMSSCQALQSIETLAGKKFEDGSRELMSYTVIFEECLDHPLETCELLINQAVQDHPEIFENRKSLAFAVNKVRELSDSDYNNVALRTNLSGDGVVGIDGDGLVYYPWEWCTPEVGCRSIGPWDCDVGTPLTVEQCCTMIKSSVPHADVNGKFLQCFVDYPVGSAANPSDYGRVRIPVNSEGIVVGVPRNE